MRWRSRASCCCWRTSWATLTAGAVCAARSLRSLRSSAEYSCWLILGPRLSSPINSPWLTSGTTILTSASFIRRNAGESNSSLSTSTTPETPARYARMGSSGEISSPGASSVGPPRIAHRSGRYLLSVLRTTAVPPEHPPPEPPCALVLLRHRHAPRLLPLHRHLPPMLKTERLPPVTKNVTAGHSPKNRARRGSRPAAGQAVSTQAARPSVLSIHPIPPSPTTGPYDPYDNVSARASIHKAPSGLLGGQSLLDRRPNGRRSSYMRY